MFYLALHSTDGEALAQHLVLFSLGGAEGIVTIVTRCPHPPFFLSHSLFLWMRVIAGSVILVGILQRAWRYHGTYMCGCLVYEMIALNTFVLIPLRFRTVGGRKYFHQVICLAIALYTMIYYSMLVYTSWWANIFCHRLYPKFSCVWLLSPVWFYNLSRPRTRQLPLFYDIICRMLRFWLSLPLDVYILWAKSI